MSTTDCNPKLDFSLEKRTGNYVAVRWFVGSLVRWFVGSLVRWFVANRNLVIDARFLQFFAIAILSSTAFPVISRSHLIADDGCIACCEANRDFEKDKIRAKYRDLRDGAQAARDADAQTFFNMLQSILTDPQSTQEQRDEAIQWYFDSIVALDALLDSLIATLNEYEASELAIADLDYATCVAGCTGDGPPCACLNPVPILD